MMLVSSSDKMVKLEKLSLEIVIIHLHTETETNTLNLKINQWRFH